LCDAFQVPKPLSLKLLPFGKSDDDLGELTFELGLFSVLSMRSGRSARGRRTVREEPVLRVFFLFLLGFAFDPFWFRVLVGSGFGQSAAAGGRSAGAWRIVRVLSADGPLFRVVSGGSGHYFGRSAAQGRIVRGVGADGPQQQAGRSAWLERTVRPAWLDSPPEADSLVL
jgi:hypothetical protein